MHSRHVLEKAAAQESAGHSADAALARAVLRARLLRRRAEFLAAAVPDVRQTLATYLVKVLTQLEPRCLGLYWPIQNEFNAPEWIVADTRFAAVRICLPFAQRNPVSMHYRTWHRALPDTTDDFGIPSCTGTPQMPDVVLVPCVGYTRGGHRLGYGAGCFDRWIADNRQVTAIGVAWSVGQIDQNDFSPAEHDQALACVVTELGVL